MIASIVVLTLVRGAVYALLALGMSLIYGVGRIINLAHTAFFMLAAFAMFYFLTDLGWGLVPSIAAAVIGISLLGILVYRFLIDRVREHHATVLLITVALAMVIQELMRISFGSLPSNIPSWLAPFPGYITIFGILVPRLHMVTLGVVVAVIVLLSLLLSRTKLGIAIRSTAQDAEVASLMGISVSRTLMLTMGIGAGLAGIAAVLTLPLEGMIYYGWLRPLMITLVIVVLGGLGSIKGSVLGALIIALVEALVVVLMPAQSYLYTVFALAAMVIILVVRPAGLFGIIMEEERL